MLNTRSENVENTVTPLMTGRGGLDYAQQQRIVKDSRVTSISRTPVLSPLYTQSFPIVQEVMKSDFVSSYMRLLADRRPETLDHSIRDAVISVDIGKDKGLSGDDLILLAQSALFHDIGKLQIPGYLLGKKNLTEDDRQHLRQHPMLGYEMLDRGLERYAVLLHHTFKKDPYPQYDQRDFTGMDKILMLTEILAVSDILDALLDRTRTYKNPSSLQTIVTNLGDEFTGDRELAELALMRIDHNPYPI